MRGLGKGQDQTSNEWMRGLGAAETGMPHRWFPKQNLRGVASIPKSHGEVWADRWNSQKVLDSLDTIKSNKHIADPKAMGINKFVALEFIKKHEADY
jgi:hypothetical protein